MGEVCSKHKRNKFIQNIEADLRKIGCESVDWIHLSQGKDQQQALVTMVMKLWIPQ
jgi:hypothetical protein